MLLSVGLCLPTDEACTAFHCSCGFRFLLRLGPRAGDFAPNICSSLPPCPRAFGQPAPPEPKRPEPYGQSAPRSHEIAQASRVYSWGSPPRRRVRMKRPTRSPYSRLRARENLRRSISRKRSISMAVLARRPYSAARRRHSLTGSLSLSGIGIHLGQKSPQPEPGARSQSSCRPPGGEKPPAALQHYRPRNTFSVNRVTSTPLNPRTQRAIRVSAAAPSRIPSHAAHHGMNQIVNSSLTIGWQPHVAW